MLGLFSAELTETEAEEVFSRFPELSREKLKNRRRSGDISGELLRLYMTASCGAPPEFAVGPHGKPFSPSRPDISYNISHSRTLAVGALLTGGMGEVGVDVEFVDRERRGRCERIAERFFTERERAEIEVSVDPVLAFYLLWTRKEALLKYTGEGFSAPLAGAEHVSGVIVRSRVIYGADGREYAFSVSARKDAFGKENAECKGSTDIKYIKRI